MTTPKLTVVRGQAIPVDHASRAANMQAEADNFATEVLNELQDAIRTLQIRADLVMNLNTIKPGIREHARVLSVGMAQSGNGIEVLRQRLGQ